MKILKPVPMLSPPYSPPPQQSVAAREGLPLSPWSPADLAEAALDHPETLPL